MRSDVDLLVVYTGEPRDDAFTTVRRCMDTRGVEPHVYTADEAEALRDTIDRMTEGGVELFPEGRSTASPLSPDDGGQGEREGVGGEKPRNSGNAVFSRPPPGGARRTRA